MAVKEIIATDNAPQAIGTYSQAVKVDNTIYLSGQIPLIPSTMCQLGSEISNHYNNETTLNNIPLRIASVAYFATICTATYNTSSKIIVLTMFSLNSSTPANTMSRATIKFCCSMGSFLTTSTLILTVHSCWVYKF